MQEKQPPKGYPDSRPFNRKELETLYRSNKQVIFIDVPAQSPLVKSTDKVVASYTQIDLKDDFAEILQSIKNKGRSLVDTQRERGEYMLSQLEPKIQKLLKDVPTLKKKQQLKILIQVGAFHTFLYHALKKRGKEVERNTPLTFGIGLDVIRRYRFGKEVDDTLIARSALDRVLYSSTLENWLDNITTSMDKKDQFRRYICSKFSLEEIKEVFEAWRQNDFTFIDRKVKEKGAIFPSSEKELDELLAKPLPRQDTRQE